MIKSPDAVPGRAVERARPPGDGMLVVSAGRRICAANTAAEHILDAADSLISVGGRLVALKPVDDRRLGDAVSGLIEGRNMPDGSPCLALPLARRSGRPDYLLLLSRGADSCGACSSQGDVGPTRHIFVVIHDFDARLSMPMHFLQQCFGLTPAEARLTVQLAGGCTPEQAARAFSVSITTIRTHLRSIYRKTATSGQVHLAQRMAAAWAAASVATAMAASPSALPAGDSFSRMRRGTSQPRPAQFAPAPMRQALTQ